MIFLQKSGTGSVELAKQNYMLLQRDLILCSIQYTPIQKNVWEDGRNEDKCQN